MGGSLTTLQLDDNGPLDLLIGDVTYPTIIGVLLEDTMDRIAHSSLTSISG